MATVKDLGEDSHICRYLAAWLSHRQFSAHPSTPEGQHYSSWRRMSRGLPQGGVLSPFLWLLHSNQLVPRLMKAHTRRIGPTGGVFRKHLINADDLLRVIARPHRPTLQLAAWEAAASNVEELGELGLNSSQEKSENMLFGPW